MRLTDYLSAFSIDDLRTLAERRKIALTEHARRSRQVMVQTLAAALARYDSVYPALVGLSVAELEVMHYLMHGGKDPSLTDLSVRTGVPAEQLHSVLDSLRLWGLAFPQGDWEYLVLPDPVKRSGHYLPLPPLKRTESFTLHLKPPDLEPATVACEERPGSMSWDIAEFLARAARSPMKLTQAGRFNRRDLRSMESAYPIDTPGIVWFVAGLCGSLSLMGTRDYTAVIVRDAADGWLTQEPDTRTRSIANAWSDNHDYVECLSDDPTAADYLPRMAVEQRKRALSALSHARFGVAYTMPSLGELLAWSAPLAFHTGGALAAPPTWLVSRLVRSLYWLGLVSVDNPDTPQHWSLTALGARISGVPGNLPAPIPDDPQFFLQPNAEAFAPPNLSPRTYFHLRRITGEKKGGPRGMFPLTADSLRRALDAGSTGAQIRTFLERFSRTGLPANVATLVETAARQHGRIRLAPASYVLVVDQPELLRELQSLKTVEPLLQDELTQTVVRVDAADVADLMKKLRARGYAPRDEREQPTAPALAVSPEEQPTWEPSMPAGRRSEAAQVMSRVLDAEEPVSDPSKIRVLLSLARQEQLVVEIEYHGLGKAATVREIWPLDFDGHYVDAYCCLREAERQFSVDRIAWLRLTGESFS